MERNRQGAKKGREDGMMENISGGFKAGWLENGLKEGREEGLKEGIRGRQNVFHLYFIILLSLIRVKSWDSDKLSMEK